MITSKDLALARATRAAQHDCITYVGLRADLNVAGDAPRVEVSTEEVRHLLRTFDAMRAAARERLPRP